MARKNSWNWSKAIDLPMAVAALLTVAFYVVVNQESLKGSLIHRYTTKHFVEYVVVTFFIWGLVDVVFRLCGFPLELVALRETTFPSELSRTGLVRDGNAGTALRAAEVVSRFAPWPANDARAGVLAKKGLGRGF